VIETLELKRRKISDIALVEREVRRDLFAQTFPKGLKQIRLGREVAVHSSSACPRTSGDGLVRKGLIGRGEKFEGAIENVFPGDCRATIFKTRLLLHWQYTVTYGSILSRHM
jgi:hypothetical protein